MIAKKVALWLAQGLGTGLMPIVPGTFGSGLGFLWFLLIIAPGNFALFAGAVLFSFFVAVLCSDIAEKILHQHDPNCIVIDEIIAIPICFLGWMAVDPTIDGPMWFFTAGRLQSTAALTSALQVAR